MRKNGASDSRALTSGVELSLLSCLCSCSPHRAGVLHEVACGKAGHQDQEIDTTVSVFGYHRSFNHRGSLKHRPLARRPTYYSIRSSGTSGFRLNRLNGESFIQDELRTCQANHAAALSELPSMSY